ncbi:unnamed protein product [Dovyalis caffra]|uniref:Uncharacterized protein n=1 Tax=Dovyalis caffra TaxID=77055 RepID=A0AAV1RTF1_9ROSI|nr:unnamed protein product [Dovyalis caffra]
MLEDSIDARLALVSLILEDAKEDEAISLLSPPKDLAMGMLQEFVNAILPLVRESLYVKTLRPKDEGFYLCWKSSGINVN